MASQAWVRPDDDDVITVTDALAWHLAYVRDRGFPVSALIVEAVLNDVRADGALADVLASHVRFGDLVSLRVMAAVHRLALDRAAPSVALHLPTLGGLAPATDADRARFREAVVAALSAEEPILRASLAQAPQTNETGRAALLRAVLSRLDPELPVRLREIGTSAGLNLRADHLPGLAGLEAGPLAPIRDRVGCDLHPIDPATAAGRLALTSYVWVDDVARFERLRRALRIAELVPATVVTADAADFAEELALEDGTTTVLWHSAFWLYLTERTRKRIIAAISALGASATPTRRFAHASWEWAGQPDSSHPEFVLVLQSWSGSAADGVSRVVAAGDSHGNSVALVSD